MKNLTFILVFSSLLFTACSKNAIEKYDFDFGNEDPVMTLESGYTASEISAIEKPTDYEYNTKGIIEYSKEGMVLATFDFGDGTKDTWALLSMNSNNQNIDLSGKKKDVKYTKVITSPLIKIEGCDYIVEGTIKYFEGKIWVATVDYGDGTCDEFATKTWKDGTETFSLKKK